MDTNSNYIFIETKAEGQLEARLSSNRSSLASNCIQISGPLNDEDIVYLGKFVRSHSQITKIDLYNAAMLTSIDHNAFEQCKSIVEFILPLCINRIGEHAFEQCTSLKTLVLPNNTNIIGDKAFCGCKELESINIPENVSYIGVGAFYGCYGLTDILVDPNNPRYENRGGVLFDNVDKTLLRYVQTKKLENNFKTPEGVVHIGNYAFDGCRGLISVIVNEGCTDLGERSFTRCNDLKKIDLPATVNNLSFNAFDECNALEEIKVDKQNSTYNSKRGVLYTKDMSTLVLCPKSKKSPFFFPNCVENINNGAFSGCKNLRTVILPKKTKKIGIKAFCDCENLEYLDIPNSLERIDDFAFANCKKLNKIKIHRFTPPLCGVNPFASINTEYCFVYVPIDSEMDFRKDYGWNSFKNIEESVEQTIGANFPYLRNLKHKIKRIFITHKNNGMKN